MASPGLPPPPRPGEEHISPQGGWGACGQRPSLPTAGHRDLHVGTLNFKRLEPQRVSWASSAEPGQGWPESQWLLPQGSLPGQRPMALPAVTWKEGHGRDLGIRERTCSGCPGEEAPGQRPVQPLCPSLEPPDPGR